MKHGLIMTVCGVGICGVCVGLAMPSSRTTLMATHAAYSGRSISVDASTLLRTIGVPGDHLLVAGFSTQQIAAGGQALAQNAAAVESYAALRAQVEALQNQRRELAQDHEADHAAALQELDARLAPLQTQLEGTRASLRALVLSGATDDQRQALARVAIGVRHGLPLDLAIAAESDQAAVKLAAALKAEGRAAHTGEGAPESTRALLLNARSRADVGAASQRMAGWAALRQSLGQTTTHEEVGR